MKFILLASTLVLILVQFNDSAPTYGSGYSMKGGYSVKKNSGYSSKGQGYNNDDDGNSYGNDNRDDYSERSARSYGKTNKVVKVNVEVKDFDQERMQSYNDDGGYGAIQKRTYGESNLNDNDNSDDDDNNDDDDNTYGAQTYDDDDNDNNDEGYEKSSYGSSSSSKYGDSKYGVTKYGESKNTGSKYGGSYKMKRDKYGKNGYGKKQARYQMSNY